MSRSSSSLSTIDSSTQLIVAICLFGLLALGLVVGTEGRLRFLKEVGIVFDEQVELAANQIAEAVAAEDHASSP